MKCQQCSTEAPAETDPESGRLRCAQCKAFWGSGSSQSSAVRQARDILQRWSSTDLLDEISSFPAVPPLPERQVPGPTSTSNRADGDSADSRPTTSASSEKKQDESSSREESKILSLADALKQHPAAMAVGESGVADSEIRSHDDDVDSEQSVAADSELQLGVIGADAVEDVSESADDTVVAPPEEMVVAGLTPAAAEDAVKKPTRRRLSRVPVNRRVRKADDADAVHPKLSTTEAKSIQQGMDAVKKKYRVDRPGTHAPLGESALAPAEVENADPRAQDASDSQRFRIDSATSVNELAGGTGRIRGQGKSRQRYIDEAHESQTLRGPHFELTPPPRSSMTSLTGQFLAYIGVLGLTVGTAIVIYGHFGGMSEYTPTGWLVTTVAQMLLFLGVINLVSGGIEQNNHDVSHRINVLGEQLLRIEQVTESAMRGPKIPAERYAGTAGESVEHERETVSLDDRR